jgi:hypothetical protein
VHSWPPKDSLAQLNAVFSSGWTSQLGMLDTAGHSLLLFNVPDSSPHLALTESESEFGRSYISAVDSAQATPPLILCAKTLRSRPNCPSLRPLHNFAFAHMYIC